ncbi:MAG: PrsW family glutamic-type intramembrane protease [Caldimonas sp.]
MSDAAVPTLVGLLPVLTFLTTLLGLDSYKLVRPTSVVAVVAAGAAAAGASYLANLYLLRHLEIDLADYSRYVGPWVEELFKALVIVALIRAHRIGFLVDAAIFGFAVGTGFALVENVWFLHLARDAGLATWIVRGFGTAIMHGGVTAIFAVASLAALERAPLQTRRAYLPGFVAAVLLHSAFNHLSGEPKAATLAVLIALPPLFYAVFRHSESALRNWLGHGFDADARMLELIDSGSFSGSPPGIYLHELKDKFHGPLIADVLCYLRLYTELSLRAKGILMLRENGFEAGTDAATQERFAELRYLEKSIGATGLRALRPLLRMSHKELWQLSMLAEH